MPYCSVLRCTNHSGKQNLANSGISYHRFPTDVEVEEQWIQATGRPNWRPQRFSTICSQHFDEDSYLIGSKCRRLPDDAVPTKNLPNASVDFKQVKLIPVPNHEPETSDPIVYSSNRLNISLNRAQKMIRKQTLLIKKLRQQIRRDEKKMFIQNRVLNDLMEIYNLKPEDIAILKTQIIKFEGTDSEDDEH